MGMGEGEDAMAGDGGGRSRACDGERGGEVRDHGGRRELQVQQL